MYMYFKLGSSAVEHSVTSCNVSLYSKGEAEKIEDCEPGEIQLTLSEPVEPGKAGKVADDIYKYVAEFKKANIGDLKGRIDVYFDQDKSAAPLQTIEFANSWIANLHSSFNEGSKDFTISLTIYPSSVKISGHPFVNVARNDFVNRARK